MSILTPKRSTALALIAIVIVGAALRFHLLETRGFNDEAARWTFATLPWPSFWKEIWRDELNMVFYYLLLRGWLILGDSEWVIRSLSVFLGLATLPAIYFLGRQLFGKRAGLISAALLAVHTFHIRYSQEARSYVLVTLLLVLSTYFFVRAIEQPHRKSFWIAYLLASALACYSQFFALLVLVAQWLSLGFARARAIGLAPLLCYFSIFALLLSPLIAFLVSQSNKQVHVQLDWIPGLTRGSLIGFFYFFTGDAGNVLLLLYSAVCVIALLALSRRQLTGDREQSGWSVRLVALWLIFPSALVIAMSLAKPIFQPRYLLMCLPALGLLAGHGIARLSRLPSIWKLLAPVTFLSILALSIFGARKQFETAKFARNSLRPMTAYLLAHQQSDDALFFFPSTILMPFNYYTHRERAVVAPKIIFPSFHDIPPGEPILPSAADVAAAVRDQARVWLVLNLRHSSEASPRGREVEMIRATLQEHFRLQEQQIFSGEPKMAVALYIATHN